MATEKDILASLQKIGLSDHEAIVYLSMLQLGTTTVLKVARRSGIKRTTIYSVIDSLTQRGLVTIAQRGFKKYYQAAPPEKLESIVEDGKRQFTAILPEIQALYNLGDTESFIKYYHGIESVKSVYESLLKEVKPGDDYLIISNPERWHKLAPEFFSDFLARRSILPIKVRTLFEDVPWGRKRKDQRIDKNQEIKFLPKGTNLSTNLVVIPTKVVVHQLLPPVMAIVIENKSIIQLHRETFEVMWKALP